MSEIEKTVIMEMLREISQKLEGANDPQITVDVNEIAKMFGNKGSSGYRIVKAPGFPAPCNAEGYFGRCWLKSDVTQFARTQQIKNKRALA